MANMSYIRFQNTLQDLTDCYEVLCVSGITNLSDEEKDSAIRLIQLATVISIKFDESDDDKDEYEFEEEC